MADESKNSPPSNGSSVASLIDWNAGRQTVGGDEALLLDVAQAFLVEAPIQLDGIRKSLDVQDARLLRRMAHTLKSSARIFGILPVCELCFTLETAGEQESFAGTRESYDKLAALMDRVIVEMKRTLPPGGAA